MTTATATTVDLSLLDALGAGCPGSVHSVFRTAVNVQRPDGTLWSVVSPRHPAGPATLGVDIDEPGRGLSPGEPVRLDGQRLALGELSVDLSRAVPRERRVVKGRPTPAAVVTLRGLIELSGTPGGVIPGTGTSGFGALVGTLVAERLHCLTDAVGREDLAAATAAAGRLLGLGVGLTPSGDDALVGFAVACHHLALPIGTRAVSSAVEAGGTHPISLAALQAALTGDAVDPLLDLVAAVCAPDGAHSPDAIAAALSALLAIGHTSGTDLACGVHAAMTITTDAR